MYFEHDKGKDCKQEGLRHLDKTKIHVRNWAKSSAHTHTFNVALQTMI